MRRVLLGAHVPPVAAVWLVRRIRHQDVQDSLQHLRSTGQTTAAEQLAYAWDQLREAAHQWETALPASLTSRASADGNAETVAAEIARESGRDEVKTLDLVVDTAAAAGLLGLSERRVRQLLAGGPLVGRKRGRQWLVERDSIEQMQRDRRLVG